MKVTTLGIDLAKSILRIHGVDVRGAAVLRKQSAAVPSEALTIGAQQTGRRLWCRSVGIVGNRSVGRRRAPPAAVRLMPNPLGRVSYTS